MRNKFTLFFLITIVLSSLVSCSGDKPIEIQAAELRFACADWPEQVNLIDSVTALADLKQEWRLWQSVCGTPANQEAPSYRLEIRFANETPQLFFLTHDLRLFNESLNTEYLAPPKTMQRLRTAAAQLDSMRFGELLTWKEASRLLPRYSSFTLMDLETGLLWKTQRRAGSLHADVQPLTKQDTLQLKTVYGGAWSWDRRAVVVLAGDRRIAASINGMPHGAGALRNGFPGHHCLHFWESTTHTQSKPDPAHQVMVHKAAGKLHTYLAELHPTDLQLAMLEMAGQGEAEVIRLGLLNPSDGTDPSQLAKQIKNIKIWDSQEKEHEAERFVGGYNVSIYFHGDAKEHRKTITLTSRYLDSWGRWLVEPDFLAQLVAR